MDGGGGGSGTTKGASVFLPPNQGGAAASYGNLLQPLTNQGLSNLQQLDTLGTPAGLAYPQIKDSAFNIVNNPYQNQAISGSQNASDIFNQQYTPFINQSTPALSGLASMGQGAASNLYGATGALSSAVNNPAYGQAGQMGSALAPTYAGAVPGLMQSAATTLNTAYDPQSDLYNRTAQRTQDQLGAYSGGTGTSASPYAAGLASDSLRNFNIDWQSTQLGRQKTGAETAGSLYTSAEGLGKAGQSSLLTPANANVAAQSTGVTGLNTIGTGIDNATTASGSAYTTGGNLLNNLASGTSYYGALPYNTYNTTQNADLAAMGNLQSLGAASYQPGQQAISDLSGYMGLGQNASQLANTIGSTNFNQQMAGAAGLGSLGLGATNTLFGTGGGSGSGLLSSGGLGGLFGGGSGADSLAGVSLGGADTLGSVTGGSSGLLDALPLALGS